MRRAARTDGCHAEIVKALRRVGCQVKDCSRVGQGFPDLIVRVGSFQNVSSPERRPWGKYVLMEVKAVRGKLNAEQQAFIRDWPETVVVRSVDEALRAVGVFPFDQPCSDELAAALDPSGARERRDPRD